MHILLLRSNSFSSQSRLIMINSLIFRRILCFYEPRYRIQSTLSLSSPSNEISSRMKKLLNEKQYREVLNLFDKQSKPWENVTVQMALEASIYLNEHQRIVDIEKKLPPSSLNNSYIQRTLVQFYSKSDFREVVSK